MECHDCIQYVSLRLYCGFAAYSFQPDASLSGIGLYRLAAEDSDDSLLASVSVAASLYPLALSLIGLSASC